MNRRPRLFRTAAAMAAVGILAAVTGYSPAGAQTQFVSFEAKANADGFRFTFGAPGFLAVDTFIDGGGPVAQSVIDGLGNSESFASLPYPSDNAISGPGLIAGLTGLPSPPPYPFYVNSSYPTQEEATFTQPGIDLKARSAEHATEGIATSGGVSGDSALGFTQAHTSTRLDGDQLIAEAAARADMMNIAGVLKIASGSATAKVTRHANGEVTRDSGFALAGISIGDQAVGFSHEGFVVAGNGTPIPPDNPLIQALREANIDVRYLAATETEHGVTSPGVIITHEFQPPGGPNLTFTYTFGRATAHVTAS